MLVTSISTDTADQQLAWQAAAGFSARLVGVLSFGSRLPNALLDTLTSDGASGAWALPSASQVAAMKVAARQLGVTAIVDAPEEMVGPRRMFLAATFGPPEPGADGFVTWTLTVPGSS